MCVRRARPMSGTFPEIVRPLVELFCSKSVCFRHLFSTRILGGLSVFSPEFARRKNGIRTKLLGLQTFPFLFLLIARTCVWWGWRFRTGFSTRKLGGLRFFSPYLNWSIETTAISFRQREILFKRLCSEQHARFRVGCLRNFRFSGVDDDALPLQITGYASDFNQGPVNKLSTAVV